MNRAKAMTAMLAAAISLPALAWSGFVQDPPATQPATQPATEPAQPPAEQPATPPAEQPAMQPAAEQAPAQQPPPEQPATQPPAAQQPAADAEGYTRTESGLRIKVTQPAGEPMTAQAGDWVSVHYTGKLENGQPFDTSLQPRPEGRTMVIKPITFKLGEKRVIAGWEEGLLGMKVGEKRTLVIPPTLAYGEAGAGGGVIPPNATLVFDVHLVGLYREEAPAPPAQGQ